MKNLLKTSEFILDHLIGIPLFIIYLIGLLIVQLFELRIWRKLIIVILVLLGCNAKSQVVIGMGAAAINFKSVGFALQAGYTFGKATDERQKANYLYYSQTVNNARGDKPQILALHYGRNFGSFQPYFGGAYHLARTDIKNNKRSGFAPDYGVTKWFQGAPIYLSLGRSGNINLLTVGIYTVK